MGEVKKSHIGCARHFDDVYGVFYRVKRRDNFASKAEQHPTGVVTSELIGNTFPC